MAQKIDWSPGTILQNDMNGCRVYRVEEIDTTHYPDYLIVGIVRLGSWHKGVWKLNHRRTRYIKVDLKFNHNNWYRPASRSLLKAIYSASSY